MTDLENFYREAKRIVIPTTALGVDKAMVDDFVTHHGQEHALGYIHALNDVFEGLEKVLYTYKATNDEGLPHQPFKARSNLIKFMSHNEEILKICNEVASYNPKPRNEIK